MSHLLQLAVGGDRLLVRTRQESARTAQLAESRLQRKCLLHTIDSVSHTNLTR